MIRQVLKICQDRKQSGRKRTGRNAPSIRRSRPIRIISRIRLKRTWIISRLRLKRAVAINPFRLRRPGTPEIKVLRYSGRFMITETDDGYCRLLTYSVPDDELLFEDYYPIPLAQARRFVDQNHRHCVGPTSHKFSIGLLQAGKLVGVIIASTPKARAQDDGFTLELNRCCVLPGQRNACSKLYGKAILAGRCMGYRRFITYTLPHESGSSLKAVNFKLDGLTQAKKKGWDHPSRPRKKPARCPEGQKCRWILAV